jgi:3-oxoacyl-[acyl-carrier-protein] synthase II
MLNNISFCQVAMSLDIQGENTVFSPHADSGAMAVAEGMKCLVDRRAQAVLCAGVSEKITPFSLARAHLCGVLNTTDPCNGQLCRPFDQERKGTVLGEGCGAIALELESSARKRAIPYVASMTGYGSSCETEGGCSGPTAKAISLAMRDGLDRAGLNPSQVDLVIAHGDGTVLGDRHEAEAIHRVFSGCVDRMMVYSSKGAIGHLQAAGPLVDVILGVCMLRDGLVPPIPNTSSPEPTFQFQLVHGGPVTKALKRILIICQSYEGQAASLILEAIDRCEGQ